MVLSSQTNRVYFSRLLSADYKPLYDEKLPIKEKIETIAREIYRADGVVYTSDAEKALNAT